MPAIVKPEHKPGQLDAQIGNLIAAIHSTQEALADLRRDDGKLKNAAVGPEQLTPGMIGVLTEAIRIATLDAATRAEQAAGKVKAAVNDVALYAKDAESAAFSAASFLSAVNAAQDVVVRKSMSVGIDIMTSESSATDAENWATYAEAQAANAKAEQEQSAAWAEYLAGPVVNPEAAPAYISNTPWGHGLYYQPVEGGLAGLWSAKWWALYAQQLVGNWGFYYLGGWPFPPVPGGVNPDTGQTVPTPLPPGSFYYDTSTETLYVWTGSEWQAPYALASGYTSRFVYQASAGQTVFSGIDFNGATPAVGASPSDVHLNGVRLVETHDYAVNAETSTLTLAIAVTAGSIIQWDLLVPPDDLIPGHMNSFKVAMTPAVPDGTTLSFTMKYTHPSLGALPTNITDGSQLQVSLDGVIQEPGNDYVASTNTLTFGTAPRADSRLWAVWFSNAVLTS